MSRRPLTLDTDQELARMAPGGRLWSESPVRRPWPRVRQAGAPVAASNPWPFSVTLNDAAATTSTSVAWTYDPHPETVKSLSFSLTFTGVAGSFYATADGVTTSTETWPASPGGGSFRFYLTPDVVGLRTVTLHWTPTALLVVTDETVYMVPETWDA